MTDADMARRHTEVFLEVLFGKGFAKPNPRPMFPNPPGLLRVEPYSEGLYERIWWGAGTNATAEWAAKLGMNLQSSTLKIDESGKPSHVQQAEQIRLIAQRGSRPGTRAPAGVGLPQHLHAGRRARPHVFRTRRRGGRPDRYAQRNRARHLRPQLRRRAGRPNRAAQDG